MPFGSGDGLYSHVFPIVLAERVSWRTPTGELVLKDVSLAVSCEKLGIVGENGSGKSTLGRLLCGTLFPTTGLVTRAGKIDCLPQDLTPYANQTISQVLGVQERLLALARLASGECRSEDLAIVNDDWMLESRVASELVRLGLGHLELDRTIETLSGGEATRVMLAALLLKQPDLIVLDEPTNNLDHESRQKLYDVVRQWPGGLVVISHDRKLLALVDTIAEVSRHGLRIYGGNIDVYRTQSDAEASAAKHQLEEAAKQLRRHQREAQEAKERQQRRNRRGKATTDKMGMSKLLLNMRRANSQLTTARIGQASEGKVASARDSLEVAKRRAAECGTLDIDLSPVKIHPAKVVLELEDVRFQHAGGEQPVLRQFSFRMTGPERVAIIGGNGSGKSTLLGLVLGEWQPNVGTVRRGVNRIHCLDQKCSLLQADRSVLENFRRWNPEIPETVCRVTLARFLFRKDAVHRLINTLSGGERLRAALACMLTGVDPPELLLLDEPTNHLDFKSLANLEQALCLYTGALLVASHDERFLEAIRVERRVRLGAHADV